MDSYNYVTPLDGTERFVERPDGTRIRTVASGAGERTVVLAHGYGAGAESWNLIAPMLVAEGLRVVVFDQRGHGESTIGSNGVSTELMASDYASILEDYDLSNAVLVGHSMGGFLSVAFLAGNEAARERVGALVLMATFAGDVSRDNAQNRMQIPMIKSGILTRLLRFGPVAKAFTKSLIGDDFEDGMVDAFIPAFHKADHANLIPILEAMVNESRYDQLDRITMPCTVVVGSKDKTTPPFHTADLHSGIAGSSLVTLPGVGHGPNWEAPEAIAGEIVKLAQA